MKKLKAKQYYKPLVKPKFALKERLALAKNNRRKNNNDNQKWRRQNDNQNWRRQNDNQKWRRQNDKPMQNTKQN